MIEKTEKRLEEIAEQIARIKYVDDSGYWTNETFSTPNKRPAEYSAEIAGNTSNDVALPRSVTQAADTTQDSSQEEGNSATETKDASDSKRNDHSENKEEEEEKDGSLEL